MMTVIRRRRKMTVTTVLHHTSRFATVRFLRVVVVSGMQLLDFVATYVDVILHRGRF